MQKKSFKVGDTVYRELTAGTIVKIDDADKKYKYLVHGGEGNKQFSFWSDGHDLYGSLAENKSAEARKNKKKEQVA